MKLKSVARFICAYTILCLFYTLPELRAQHLIKQPAVGFIVKHDAPKAEASALELARFTLTEKAVVFFAHDNKTVAEKLSRSVAEEHVKNIHVIAKAGLPEHVRAIVVLGGDGTVLSAARLMTKRSVPILGINFGRLGFLAEIEPADARPLLQKIIHGERLPVREHMMCQATLIRNKKSVFQGVAVNDVVITRETPHVVGLDVFIDNQKAYDLYGDGIIVATPTGSTAYSLSAGGPIVMPNMSTLILTPICPHALTLRPLVISGNSHVDIRLVQSTGKTYVTWDGQGEIDLQKGDVISVRRFAKHPVKIVSSPEHNYFGVLKEKLHFGAGS